MSRGIAARAAAVPLGDIKAISFDLDDTFWDCAPAIIAAEEALYRWFAAETPRIAKAHSPESLVEQRVAVGKELPHLWTDVTALRVESIRRLLLSHRYDPDIADTAFAVFYRARSNVRLYDGVVDMLDALQNKFRLAAITNGNADLEQIGIKHYFEDIQAASLDNPPKPDAYMFNRCLNLFKLPPSALLHVGDNPETDVGGGHNAGVQTLWFNQHGDPWPDVIDEPHHVVGSIADMRSLFLEAIK